MSAIELTMDERWRAVPGYEGLYEVSDHGRVRSHRRQGAAGGILRGYVNDRDGGYIAIRLRRDGRDHSTNVHRIVALAFLGPRPHGQEVRHLNGDPTDNRLSNLAYGTPSENQLDNVRHGTHVQARKTHCPQNHLYDEANTYEAPSRPGTRYCRACRRAGTRTAA